MCFSTVKEIRVNPDDSLKADQRPESTGPQGRPLKSKSLELSEDTGHKDNTMK